MNPSEIQRIHDMLKNKPSNEWTGEDWALCWKAMHSRWQWQLSK